MKQNNKRNETTEISPRIGTFIIALARRHYGALDKKDRRRFIERFNQIETNENAIAYAQWVYRKMPEIVQNQRKFRKKKLDLLSW